MHNGRLWKKRLTEELGERGDMRHPKSDGIKEERLLEGNGKQWNCYSETQKSPNELNQRGFL